MLEKKIYIILGQFYIYFGEQELHFFSLNVPLDYLVTIFLIVI